MTIPALIEGRDNFEIIRDNIAVILAAETASQQALATAGGEDPDSWKFRVFRERANPWEQFLNSPSDKSPVVNVWFDTETLDKSRSNYNDEQAAMGVFNIDCLGYAVSKDDPSGGHIPGDRGAAFTAQRILRLCRRILMHGDYQDIGFSLDASPIWERWPGPIESFQPASGNAVVQNVMGARFAMSVVYNETSDLRPSGILELLSVTVNYEPTGEVVIETDFDYT